MMAGWIFHPLVNWIVNCDHIFWGGELNIAPKMSVNLPRSGHPMVTVNRTVLCSRLSLTVVWWLKILQSIVFLRKVQHRMYLSVILVCNALQWCAVSQCDTMAAILRIHRKAFNTFAIQCSLLCDSWMHMKRVLLDSQFLLHWGEIYFTNSEKYV